MHRKYADAQAQAEAETELDRASRTSGVSKQTGDIGIIDGPVQIVVEASGF
jgi:hypothetical protein